MIHSGIAPLDAQLGGLFPGRLHLLTGGPGTGKSTACLQFLAAGLRKGEPAALVTLHRLSDLVSHARSAGLDLERGLRTGRLLVLRFRADFTRALDCAGLPSAVLDDLHRLISEIQPVRLVIDPITPFLGDGLPPASALAALARFLDELGITTIVTHPRDVSDGCDARLDPLVQRAVAILHLARGGGGSSRVRVVQARGHIAPALARRVSWPGLGPVRVERERRPAELDRALPNDLPRQHDLPREAST
jgi:KaiC/GvpD/RAD55 family RecA-like ATPase